MTTTILASADDDRDRPVVIDRYSHWVRLRWPDGRVEVTSARQAQRLGALDPEEGS